MGKNVTNTGDFPMSDSAPHHTHRGYSFCTIYFWFLLELQIPFRFITSYIIWGNRGRLKNVLEPGSVSPCLVSGLPLPDALISLSYLVGSVSYRHLCHPMFCLRIYFYPHLHLLTLNFFLPLSKGKLSV